MKASFQTRTTSELPSMLSSVLKKKNRERRVAAKVPSFFSDAVQQEAEKNTFQALQIPVRAPEASHASFSSDQINKLTEYSVTKIKSHKPQEIKLDDGAQNKWSLSVQCLIDWYTLNESKLPVEAFALSSYEKVDNPARFYERIRSDIASTPNKFRESHLLNVLEKLRKLISA